MKEPEVTVSPAPPVKKVRQALAESIKHWERMRDFTKKEFLAKRLKEAPSCEDCPLCQIHRNTNGFVDCCNCPIRRYTNLDHCADTPFADAYWSCRRCRELALDGKTPTEEWDVAFESWGRHAHDEVMFLRKIQDLYKRKFL